MLYCQSQVMIPWFWAVVPVPPKIHCATSEPVRGPVTDALWVRATNSRSWGLGELGGPLFHFCTAKFQLPTHGTNQDTGRSYLPVGLWNDLVTNRRKKTRTDVFGSECIPTSDLWNLTYWDSDSDEVSQSWPCLNNHQGRLCLEGAGNCCGGRNLAKPASNET